MTERELHLSILKAIKAHQDANGGAHIPFETLATKMGFSTDDMQNHLRSMKNSDIVRYTQDDKTYIPLLIEVSRNGNNRIKDSEQKFD
jgi:DNA-binding IclR family transcriptional regulator